MHFKNSHLNFLLLFYLYIYIYINNYVSLKMYALKLSRLENVCITSCDDC